MPQQVNGRDNHDALVEEMKAVVGDIPGREQSLTLVERVRDTGMPFEQKAHTLMLESIDKIAQQWIGELDGVRQNTKVVEEMVIAQTAAVKDAITKLHLLGTQAMKEAQRGHEVSQQLAAQLDAMMEHSKTH